MPLMCSQPPGVKSFPTRPCVFTWWFAIENTQGVAQVALTSSAKDAKLAQKLGQLQPFMAVSLLECTGQLAYFGTT